LFEAADIFSFFDAVVTFWETAGDGFAAWTGVGRAGFTGAAVFGAGFAFAGGALRGGVVLTAAFGFAAAFGAGLAGLRAGAAAFFGAGFFAGFAAADFFWAAGLAAGLRLLVAIYVTIVPRRSRVIA